MTNLPHPTRMFSTFRVIKGVKSLIFGPTPTRRRALHELARVAAELLGGHYIGDDYKLWLSDEGFCRRFKALSPHNYFSMERKYALKEFARSTRNLDGAVAECGSYTGVAAWFIANEISGVEFYLFDSFEGLSMPSEKDLSPEGVQQWSEGDLASIEEVLRERMKEFSNIHIMKGWIPERFSEVDGQLFKLVHIDVDLYEPTLSSLEFFYDRMVAGGIIVMDDYGFENCPGAFAAANEFMLGRAETIVHLPTGQGVIIKKY
ncbi:MAG: TylF/MycF family methyltransferase [Gammaproteobacteria bacterium]|nr:TylF/MycF family methyltransferase [Gammaproteobacteria bacterium]